MPRVFWGLILHIPLGLLLTRYAFLATLHAYFIVALGIWFIIRDRTPLRLIYVCGYIAGAELLWRMARADVFWEFGKISIAFLLMLAVVKWQFRVKLWPIFYALLFLPSVIITLNTFSLNQARQQISFNLGGHFLIALGMLVFSQVILTRTQLRDLMLIIVMPVMGVATNTLFSTISQEVIFTGVSNFTTSGGFGPNQVSAILGLGALFSWLWVIAGVNNPTMRWLLLAISLWMIVQATLTFSRGGVFNFIVAASIGSLLLIGGQRGQARNLVLIFFAFVTVVYILMPRLEIFTGGLLSIRYTDLNPTGRVRIMLSDLQIWQENIWLGVGAGGAVAERIESWGRVVIAHTEYTRLLAEHGLLGLVALVWIFLITWRGYRQAPGWAKGVMLALSLWSLAEMTHAAMRISAVSYLLTIPLAHLTDEE